MRHINNSNSKPNLWEIRELFQYCNIFIYNLLLFNYINLTLINQLRGRFGSLASNNIKSSYYQFIKQVLAMAEREKMLAGEMYNLLDEDLLAISHGDVLPDLLIAIK